MADTVRTLWLLRHGETPWSALGRHTGRTDVALFAHGHLLRTLAARWLDLPPRAGGSLTLDTASVSVLGVERERCVIHRWNEICHLAGE